MLLSDPARSPLPDFDGQPSTSALIDPDPRSQYRRALAASLGVDPGQVRLYWRGRVALYAALRALGIGPGDEVVLPALTCVVVPNAILYLGATPVYCDIDPSTLTIDPEAVRKAIGPRTRALIIQNTFGLSADVEALCELARARGIASIEDATHGFGSSCGGRLNGTVADFSFFSTQWNKPFSTGLGGILVSNRPALDASLDAFDRELPAPPNAEVAKLRALLRVRHRIGERHVWTATRVFRRLTALGLVTGSSAPTELVRPTMPDGWAMSFPSTLAACGLTALAGLPAVMQRRREIGDALTALMKSLGKWHISDRLPDDNGFLKFPLLVTDRPAFLRAAQHAGVGVGDWFVSALHPVVSDLSPWGLDVSQVPVARERATRLVCLNTEVKDLDRLVRFITAQRESLL